MSSTNRLTGEITGNGRDTSGRFAPGNPGGPGRPRRETERDYLKALTEAVPLDLWRAIVEQTAIAAGRGDYRAREWLGNYLMGRPEGVAATLHALAVDEMAGVDVVEQDANLAALSSWP
jgi:hypothetical protein